MRTCVQTLTPSYKARHGISICNPSKEAETFCQALSLWVSLASQPSLFVNSQDPVREHVSKSMVDGFRGMIPKADLGPVPMNIHGYMHLHAHTQSKEARNKLRLREER